MVESAVWTFEAGGNDMDVIIAGLAISATIS